MNSAVSLNEKTSKFLLYADGPLSQDAGTALSKVTDVCQFYGQTETDPIQVLLPRRDDWANLEWHLMQEAITEHSVNGTCEMVLKRNPALEGTRSISCNCPNVEVWRTKDFFQPHPAKPYLRTFHEQTDDIIVLSNGEKFYPVLSDTQYSCTPPYRWSDDKWTRLSSSVAGIRAIRDLGVLH
ncbi:hypothetical protein F4775DRAFT_478332 [Biscogniauxia sp. FL1348]|nr:hypothetical protein F4775DRAFT_478332 [Biscogniauxia sp. FL1348]